MDHHLNVFRFFNESTEKEFIENNLSRAFALCLTTNAFFLNEYVKGIVSDHDYHYLFSSISSHTRCTIDIQVDTATIEKENYKTVYAVAMTSDPELDMRDFFSQPKFSGKKNITDIFVAVKDIAIIIEVKRSGEDCKAQLYNQILPFIKGAPEDKIAVKPKGYSWQAVVVLLEKVKHVQHLVSQNSKIIADFLELSEVKYPEWFEPKPFSTIPFLAEGKTPNHAQLEKRMRQALGGVSRIAGDDYQLLPYRLGISVPFGWASEFVTYFVHCEEEIADYLEFNIWPANTKQQGWSVFDKPLDWTKKQALAVGGKEYKLSIEYEVKLCHYNRYVTGIEYSESDILKPLHAYENFINESGKWTSDKWKDLERLLDEHFKPEFEWRKQCDWSENFTNTDRSYLTMSLGFRVRASIPYSKFQSLDKKDADITKVSNLISKIVSAFKGLIN